MSTAPDRHAGAGWYLPKRGPALAARDASLRWHDGLRAAIITLLALLATPAFPQTFPAFTGLVTDAANVLPADRKAALEQKLEAFQQRTHRQLVVATIPDLQGYPIEDYGYRLGRSWGVGLKDADNGAILIVAPNERKVRVEVGRRLEPVLTDAVSSVVIQTKVLPAFKAGDMAGGIEAGADAIAEQLSLPDDQARAEADKAAKSFDAAHQRRRSGSGAGLPLGIIFWVMVVGFVILAHNRRRQGPWGGQRYRSGGGSDWPIWLWAASEMFDGHRDRDRGGGFTGGGSVGDIFGGGGGGGSDGSWGGGGFTGGGGGDFGGGGASGSW